MECVLNAELAYRNHKVSLTGLILFSAKKHGLRSEEERRGKEGKPQPTVHFLLLPIFTFSIKGLKREVKRILPQPIFFYSSLLTFTFLYKIGSFI